MVRKRILIVGGGPAGLECARILCLRGHEVTLKEKEDHLGGQAWLASIPSEKALIGTFVSHLVSEINRLGVSIELNSEFSAKDTDQLNMDAIILATGASPTIPNIPGIKGDNMRTGFEVLKSKGEGLGGKIVIIGGGEVGCEIAQYLAEKGKKVTIIEQLNEIGLTMEPFTKRVYLEKIFHLDLQVLTSQNVTRADGNSVHMTDLHGGVSSIEFDHAVLATGTVSNNRIWEELFPRFPSLYRIGDCVEPRDICQAIYEGGKLGRAI